jgi:hypothetical protein
MEDDRTTLNAIVITVVACCVVGVIAISWWLCKPDGAKLPSCTACPAIPLTCCCV